MTKFGVFLGTLFVVVCGACLCVNAADLVLKQEQMLGYRANESDTQAAAKYLHPKVSDSKAITKVTLKGWWDIQVEHLVSLVSVFPNLKTIHLEKSNVKTTKELLDMVKKDKLRLSGKMEEFSSDPSLFGDVFDIKEIHVENWNKRLDRLINILK